jgi:hypothetical protein
MTDSEILQWLVDNNAIDMPMLGYMRIMGDQRVALVRDRIFELTRDEDDK